MLDHLATGENPESTRSAVVSRLFLLFLSLFFFNPWQFANIAVTAQ